MNEKVALIPELIWMNNDVEGFHWSLIQSLCIGRENADITIPVPAVSRKHAQVHVAGGYYAIEDLSSQNGTALNGQLLGAGEGQQLRHGDIIVLAGMVELKFIDPFATPIAPKLGRLRGIWIDEENGDVWVDAKKIVPRLPRKQQSLLQLIYHADGKVVSRDEIVASVWTNASADGISNDAIESLIKRLRKKLKAYSSRPLLELVRDRGVRLIND